MIVANNYQFEVSRTMRAFDFTLTPKEMALANYAMGLSGEAGEAADALKKALFHRESGQPLKIDLDHMKKEIGDVLWYASALALELGFDLDSVMSANVEKLRKRYPEGFTGAASVARADEKKGVAP